jgi:hypothetical protein
MATPAHTTRRDTCPGCDKTVTVSDRPSGTTRFTEPVCEDCREEALREAEMDSFDVAYERARANGWAD